MCGDRNNQLSYAFSTNSQGIGVLLGGNYSLATPYKRITSSIGPAGTFKNDPLLGAPAFDGGVNGDPQFYENVEPLGVTPPVKVPDVNEAIRLLHNGDVNIGEGIREHEFTDGIHVGNVWGTLWKTEPSPVLKVTRRNYFFQVNPDSPLPVFLWQFDLTLKHDLPNKGFNIALAGSAEDRLWVLRGSDQRVFSGTWESTPRTNGRGIIVPFGNGAYGGLLDSPLGGMAVYSLSDGLQAWIGLPGHSRINLSLTAANSPQKQGDTAHVELLLLGIPRLTDATLNLPSCSTEVVERFYHDFGLDGGATGYTVVSAKGTVTGHRYILEIDGTDGQAFSGQLTGNLISSLPITVSHLHNHWSAYLYDRIRKKARPLGMFENKAWATVSLTGRQDLFIGHPLTADNEEIVLQVTQSGETSWNIEAHNPTEHAITTTLRKNPLFDPWQAKPFTEEAVTIPAGSSITRTL